MKFDQSPVCLLGMTPPPAKSEGKVCVTCPAWLEGNGFKMEPSIVCFGIIDHEMVVKQWLPCLVLFCNCLVVFIDLLNCWICFGILENDTFWVMLIHRLRGCINL